MDERLSWNVVYETSYASDIERAMASVMVYFNTLNRIRPQLPHPSHACSTCRKDLLYAMGSSCVGTVCGQMIFGCSALTAIPFGSARRNVRLCGEISKDLVLIMDHVGSSSNIPPSSALNPSVCRKSSVCGVVVTMLSGQWTISMSRRSLYGVQGRGRHLL